MKNLIKNFVYVTIAILISVLTVYFALTTTQTVFALDTELYENKIETQNCNEKSDYAYIGYEDDYIPLSNIISVPFIVHSNDNIASYNFSQSGFRVLSSEKSNNPQQIIFYLEFLQDYNNINSLEIEIYLNSGKKIETGFYAIYNENGIFISDVSKDDALEKFLSFAISHNLIDTDQSNEIRMLILEDSAIENSSDSANTVEQCDNLNVTDTLSQVTMANDDTYLEGELQWKDDENNLHPLQGIKVEIYDSTGSNLKLLGTTYTYNGGNYSFSFVNNTSIFENGYDLVIRAYAGDHLINVVSNNGESYYYESVRTGCQNVVTGRTYTINATLDMESSKGRAMQISQALMTVEDFVRVISGKEPKRVTVKYPSGDGCFVNFTTRTITLLGNQWRIPYARWDILMKAYGKLIAYDLGLYENIQGNYDITDDIAILRDKEEAKKLAWGEAWSTTFALIAQKYYSDRLTNIADVNGSVFKYLHSSGNLDIDIETTDISKGDACEATIAAVLWDLFDSQYETNDSLNLGYEDWWNVTTGSQAKTFSAFIAYFYNQYKAYEAKIGANLTYYKIAPSEVTCTSNANYELSKTPPTFTWIAQGGENSHPNNYFYLVFYLSDYSNSLEFEVGANTSYTLTDAQWRSVLYFPDEKIHIAVKGYQTGPLTTVGYISEAVSFTRPIYTTEETNDGKLVITGFYGSLTGDIEIPSEIDNKEIVGIKARAFSSKSYITSINLPSTIQTIGEYAFYNCIRLESVSMNTTKVTRIEEGVFNACSALSEIDLPDNISYIGSRAFATTQISSMLFSSSDLTIENLAFENCTSLTLYVENSTRPENWAYNWNVSNRPVFWGCTLSSDKSYVISFNKTSSNPSNINATNGISNPYRIRHTFEGWYTTSDYSGTKYENISSAPNGTLYAKWTKNSCVAEGTLITLADGSQTAVENLTGNENLLVWNMLTGAFESAPILFIDSDPISSYEIIKLTFSDGTFVKVIDEHAFFDCDLNKYIFLTNDASQYIGHYFNKQSYDEDGNMVWVKVKLTSVDIYTEQTTAWSPVTFGHLCYYVNGMLSMPGATEGFINIFEVDGVTMKYDEEQMAEDIESYGLYTYEEFNAIIPVPEIIFQAFNGQYLKVSVGKGLITLDEIRALIERYSVFFISDEE